MVTVSRLNIAPVKGTQLRRVEEIRLDHHGVRENRRFYLIDDQDEMVNSLRLGALQTAVFSYSDEDRRLQTRAAGRHACWRSRSVLGAPVHDAVLLAIRSPLGWSRARGRRC